MHAINSFIARVDIEFKRFAGPFELHDIFSWPKGSANLVNPTSFPAMKELIPHNQALLPGLMDTYNGASHIT